MPVQRKQYSAELKTRVALEAIDGLPDVFSLTRTDQKKSEEDLIASLYQEIGHLKMQVDWLEKKSKAFR